MKMRQVQLGIIGCSGYAYELIKRLWTIPRNARLVCVAAIDVDPRFTEGNRRNGTKVFTNVDEMLDYAKGRCDAILNPTPIHMHAIMAEKCLRAGFPVLMEKPPVATIQDLDYLVGLSKELKLPIAVCFNSIYSFAVQQLKAELLEGKYGAIKRIRSIGGWVRTDTYFNRNNWAGKLRVDGGWVLDGTINNPLAHLLADCLFFAAPEHRQLAAPVSVQAELYRGHAIESEDTASLRVINEEGIEIIGNFSLCPENEITPSTIIETEQAEIEFVDFAEMHIHYRNGNIVHRESYKENRIEMFEHLCQALNEKSEFLCDLEMCRPFTLSVNAAFDSSGPPRKVPEQFLSREPCAGSIKTVIKGLDAAMIKAHRAGCLLSEIGVPWAKAGTVVDTRSYTEFPENSSYLSLGAAVVNHAH
jgi:predicted dehydrogenase